MLASQSPTRCDWHTGSSFRLAIHRDPGFGLSTRLLRLVKSKMPTDPETQLRHQPVPGLCAALPYPAFVNNFLWSVRELPSKKLLFKFYIRRIASGRFKADIFNGLGVTVALCATAYFNLVDRPWWLTNLMGFAFAYSSLQIISPTTFVTGALVLLGLFCYDIYMVFFT